MKSKIFNWAIGCSGALLLAMPVAAYEEVEVSDGAVIEGRVSYDGRIPTRKIVPTKDREVCGSIREWQLVERDADNGLKNAMVYLEEIERGKPWPEGETMESPVIDNRDCMFDPHVMVIRPGDIDVHNSDDVLHNTKAYYGRRAVFNLALPDAGMTIKRKLPRPGIVRFECDAHGWMEAWVNVLTHPYYAVTGEDGTFRIADVPPGEYTLIVRHEYIGESKQAVTAAADETVELSLELTK